MLAVARKLRRSFGDRGVLQALDAEYDLCDAEVAFRILRRVRCEGIAGQWMVGPPSCR
jgi:hypothetical protein